MTALALGWGARGQQAPQSAVGRVWAFLLEEACMRSLLFAICAAAVFAIWASGARAEPPCESTSTIDAQSGLTLRGL
jgi:hypothetical protein